MDGVVAWVGSRVGGTRPGLPPGLLWALQSALRTAARPLVGMVAVASGLAGGGLAAAMVGRVGR